MQFNRNTRKGMSMRKYMNIRSNDNYNQIIMASGSRGEDVENLQKMLVTIAEDYSSIPVVNITSNYDDMTRKAVTELQKIMGAEPTGNVNRALWNRIHILSSKKDVVKSREETSFDESSNVISEGSKGKMVNDLQKYLNMVSEKYPTIPKLLVDGVFGPKTKSAVLEFQKLFNLEQDGIVGQITWETLYNVSIGKKPPAIFD
ncbi:MAG: peptidoglycan-binding domain-containing protein [Clostridia bacterium]|nr:peptidoglycan-binding domain-containing protein [Clostridia bacterium]